MYVKKIIEAMSVDEGLVIPLVSDITRDSMGALVHVAETVVADVE